MAVNETIVLLAALATIFALRAIRRLMRRNRNHVPHTARRPVPATLLWVVDGDTVDVEVNGVRERVRVIGIDAPETHHPDERLNCEAGRAASAYARSAMFPGQTVWLESDIEDRDVYGRLLRHVWLADPSENEYRDASMACTMASSGLVRPMFDNPNSRHRRDIVRAFTRV